MRGGGCGQAISLGQDSFTRQAGKMRRCLAVGAFIGASLHGLPVPAAKHSGDASSETGLANSGVCSSDDQRSGQDDSSIAFAIPAPKALTSSSFTFTHIEYQIR